MNGRQALAKRNADGYFDIYLAMGPHRSLEKLHTTLANGGLKLTLNTLKNYSSRYGWQSRLRAAEEMAQAQLDEERDAERLLSMNERQANYGELSAHPRRPKVSPRLAYGYHAAPCRRLQDGAPSAW